MDLRPSDPKGVIGSLYQIYRCSAEKQGLVYHRSSIIGKQPHYYPSSPTEPRSGIGFCEKSYFQVIFEGECVRLSLSQGQSDMLHYLHAGIALSKAMRY